MYSSSQSILVIDDNIDYRRYVSIVLDRAGFSVLSAENRPELLAEQEFHKISSYIVDIDFRDGEASELFQFLRLKHPTIPFLILSCTDVSRSLAQDLGASGVYKKPISPSELVKAIKVTH